MRHLNNRTFIAATSKDKVEVCKLAESVLKVSFLFKTETEKDSKQRRAFFSYSPRKNQGKMFFECLTLLRIKTGDFSFIYLSFLYSFRSVHGKVS